MSPETLPPRSPIVRTIHLARPTHPYIKVTLMTANATCLVRDPHGGDDGHYCASTVHRMAIMLR